MKDIKNSYKILICAGGTGGHIIPAITLFQKMENYEIHYICGNRKIEKMIYEKFNIKPLVLKVGHFELIKYIFIFPSLLYESTKIIDEIKPQTVVLTGNYLSLPVGIAAIIKSKKILIIEQDAVIGKTNRILSRFAYKIFTGFHPPFRYVDNKKIVHIGHVLRENIFNFSLDEKIHIDKSKKTILVVGGSQGAKHLTKALLNILIKVKDRFNIILIAGNHFEHFKDYKEFTVLPFYENIGFLYHLSDIIISRSGAITTAEIKILKKKAIFIPYETASNKEQFKNIKKMDFDKNDIIVIRENKINEKNILDGINKLLAVENKNRKIDYDLNEKVKKVLNYVQEY